MSARPDSEGISAKSTKTVATAWIAIMATALTKSILFVATARLGIMESSARFTMIRALELTATMEPASKLHLDLRAFAFLDLRVIFVRWTSTTVSQPIATTVPVSMVSTLSPASAKTGLRETIAISTTMIA